MHTPHRRGALNRSNGKNRARNHLFTRRGLLAAAVGTGGTLIAADAFGRPRLTRSSTTAELPSTPIAFKPFQVELSFPPVARPVAPFISKCDLSPDVTVRPVLHYRVVAKPGVAELIPGVQTEIWGYDGVWPGPTFRARQGEPIVVRQVNQLDEEIAIHLHGGHVPADSDGFPTDTFGPGTFKDYCYPNVTPEDDLTEVPSTMWYHDHTHDLTGPHVYRGLGGFYLVSDDLEDELVASRVLPGGDRDVPMAFQDRVLRADGQLFFDPFELDGFLGDLMCVNGKVQPYLRVQRRKYRLRLLNGSGARFWMFRLSTGAPFLQIGADSWLLPFAIRRDAILCGNGERVDVVVDFRDAPSEVFLENILVQDDGRGPDGDSEEPEVRIPGTPIVKFIVEGANVANDVTVTEGTHLRPHTPIRADEIRATRHFRFDRTKGQWAVNGRLFDPERADALCVLGTAERWIIENSSGGWWHPAHIHLEAHQVQAFNGQPPPIWNSFKKDTTTLGPNDVVEVFMKLRTFPGRFVMHCHNTAHEDHGMMTRWDLVRA